MCWPSTTSQACSPGSPTHVALPTVHRRWFRRSSALYRPGRGVIRRGPPGDPERYRGHRGATRPRGPSHLRSDPGSVGIPKSAAVSRGGAEPGPRSRPSARANSGRAARRDTWFWGSGDVPDTTLERLPRMADFALWASACETEIWPPGTFRLAYCGNRDEAVENVIEADPVAAAVRAMMEAQTEWTGTATDLLDALTPCIRRKPWSASPNPRPGRPALGRCPAASGRAATFLRKVGIDIDHSKEGGRARTRVIHITTARENSDAPDSSSRCFGGTTVRRRAHASAPSAQPPKGNGINAFAENNRRTVGDVLAADPVRGAMSATDTASTVRANPLKSADTDGADAKDASWIFPLAKPDAKEKRAPGLGATRCGQGWKPSERYGPPVLKLRSTAMTWFSTLPHHRRNPFSTPVGPRLNCGLYSTGRAAARFWARCSTRWCWGSGDCPTPS